jgi:hypothetical protein
MVIVAALTNLAAIVISVVYLSRNSPDLLVFIGGFFVISVVIEVSLRRLTGRTIRARIGSG